MCTDVHRHICTYAYIYVYVCTYVRMYILLHISVYICTQCVYTNKHAAYGRVAWKTCLYSIHVYQYINTHICVYVYIERDMFDIHIHRLCKYICTVNTLYIHIGYTFYVPCWYELYVY